MLYKHFGNDGNEVGVDGSLIANEIHYINEYNSQNNGEAIECIEVKINSPGGSVQDGLSICDAILTSKIPVTTNIVGMAYSMAGVVAMCGHKKVMNDYATFMMHNVSGGDNEEVLDLLTNSLATIFDNNTALTLDKCRELMNMETWLSAKECLAYGLIDEITTTKIKKPNAKTVNELCEFYNKITNTKINKMEKIIGFLNLNADASETVVLEKVTAVVLEKEAAVNKTTEVTSENDALKVENEALKAEKEALAAKLQAFEDIEKEKEEVAKSDVLKEAVNAGKITEESKAIWIKNPINSADLKNLFDSIQTKPAFVPAKPDEAKLENKDDRSKWTFQDWSKKDPKGLEAIHKNNKPEFDRLIGTIDTTFASKR